MKTLRPLLVLALAGLAPLTPALLAQPAPAPVAPAAPKYDFGDHVSATLTTKAWQAHAAKDHAAVAAYVGKCRELYQDTALQQQAGLTAPVAGTDREAVFALWALNDVGTCLFILGQSLEQQGNTVDAVAAYKLLTERLSYAQCWDTKGWFWRPSEAAAGRLKALEFEAAQM